MHYNQLNVYLEPFKYQLLEVMLNALVKFETQEIDGLCESVHVSLIVHMKVNVHGISAQRKYSR